MQIATQDNIKNLRLANTALDELQQLRTLFEMCREEVLHKTGPRADDKELNNLM